MLQDALSGFEGEVQAIVARVPFFENIDHAQALIVVLESCAGRVGGSQAFIEGVLSGMAERGVAQVVRQGNGLDQVFVQAQRSAMERASCATSRECVSRVRKRSPSWLRNTCVL